MTRYNVVRWHHCTHEGRETGTAVRLMESGTPPVRAEDFQLSEPFLYCSGYADEDLLVEPDEKLTGVVNRLAELEPSSPWLRSLLREQSAPPPAADTFARAAREHGCWMLERGVLVHDGRPIDLAGARVVALDAFLLVHRRSGEKPDGRYACYARETIEVRDAVWVPVPRGQPRRRAAVVDTEAQARA